MQSILGGRGEDQVPAGQADEEWQGRSQHGFLSLADTLKTIRDVQGHPIRDPRQPALGQWDQAYPRLEKESPRQEKSQVPQP